MADPLKKEWNRLLACLRKEGALETGRRVAKLIRTEQYPVYYTYRLAGRLLKQGEFEAAGMVLRAAKQFGDPDPLIDMLYGKWLWCSGKKSAAISFTHRQAHVWSASFLYNLLGAMHSLRNNNAKAKRYFAVAGSLAEQELCRH